MDKVVIIGVAGTGKTTLAFNLAAKLDARPIDLDDLYWKPEWEPAPVEEFRSSIRNAIDTPRWTMAGNYDDSRDIAWTAADTLVWLDYSLARTFAQVSRRSAQRIMDGREICNGNRETLGKLLSGDSIIFWMLRTYHAKKREHEDIFAHPERYPNIKNFVRLHNPAETRAFLTGASPG